MMDTQTLINDLHTFAPSELQQLVLELSTKSETDKLSRKERELLQELEETLNENGFVFDLMLN
ncbi:MAG: hypothetical protein R6U85_02275 [Salinivirgaceae bacterium]